MNSKIYFIVVLIGLLFSSCKQRVNSDLLAPGDPAPAEDIPHRYAQVMGLALLEYVTTGKEPSWEESIAPRLKEFGVSGEASNKFQDAILDLYLNFSPTFIDNHMVQRYLGLSWEEAGWLRYYLNFEDLKLDSPEAISFIQSAEIFRKYLANREEIDGIRRDVLRMSVQEMADARGIPVAELRSKFWRYNISLVALFQDIKAPDDSRSLYQAALDHKSSGMTDTQIAQKLGLGESALSNLFHYLNIKPHGVAWDETEKANLRQLWEHVDIKDIAQRLQRTEEGVSAMANSLSLPRYAGSLRRIRLPGFDDLGKVEVAERHKLIEEFLTTNRDVRAEDLAVLLSVEPEIITNWRQRLSPVPLNPASIAGNAARYSEKTAQVGSHEVKDKFTKQVNFIEKEVAIYEQSKEIVASPNARRLLEIHWITYVANRNIFNSNNHRLAALSQRILRDPNAAELFGILWDVGFVPPSESHLPAEKKAFAIFVEGLDQIRLEKRKQAIDTALQQIRLTGRVNDGIDGLAKQLSVASNQLAGIGGYVAGQTSFNKRIFDSSSNLYDQLLASLAQQTQVESDPVVRMRLERFVLGQSFTIKGELSSETKAKYDSHSRLAYLQWGQDFFAVTGRLPAFKEINRKSNSIAKLKNSHWENTAIFHAAVIEFMIQNGFAIKEKLPQWSSAPNESTIVRYPDNYWTSLKPLCPLINSLAFPDPETPPTTE